MQSRGVRARHPECLGGLDLFGCCSDSRGKASTSENRWCLSGSETCWPDSQGRLRFNVLVQGQRGAGNMRTGMGVRVEPDSESGSPHDGTGGK
jgi:hypothetical protein